MNVVVVSKEDIEAPWRAECEYLQLLIVEMEKNKVVEVKKEFIEVENTERVDSLLLRITGLEMELRDKGAQHRN
jgi:hypothetical protein